MMDPISASSLAIELTIICVHAIRQIKKAVETVKKVRQDLLELLSRTERMRNILELLRTLLRELRNTPHRDMEIILNDSACRQTMRELEALANKIASTHLSSSILAGAQWLSHRSKAIEMVEKLRSQETDIVNVLVIIGVASSIKTEKRIYEMKDEAVSESEAVEAFGGLTLVNESLQAPVQDSTEYEPLPTWLGHLIQEGHSEHYISAREKLSNAAYWGNWETFWQALKIGKDEYAESWVNAIRLSKVAPSYAMCYNGGANFMYTEPLNLADKMSYWTPLHQAVYNHVDDRATIELVKQMIEAGAFRTLRTRWTAELSNQDMTPLELARDLGYESLYNILAPVIRQPVPTGTLKHLQQQFHELIKSDLRDHAGLEHIYLPVLEVLTEMELPRMWFPVKSHKYSPAGYVYRLDGRELIIRSYNIKGPDVLETYRCTEEEIRNIDDALVFGS